MHNAKDLWNTPEAISLLVEVAESMERGAVAPTLDQDIILDEARHILLSGVPALIDLLPRTFTTMRTTSSDPLPPPENLPSYSSTTAADAYDGLPAPAAAPAAMEGDEMDSDRDEMQELNGLQNFFSRFLPWIGSRGIPEDEAFQRAASESGEPEEIIRQRGNRLVQLLQRVVGMNIGVAPQPALQTREGTNPTATELTSAARDVPDDVEDGSMPDIPADGRNLLGGIAQDHGPSTSQGEPYDDEKNQRWLAGQGMIRLRDFTAEHGADENAWGSHTAEGEALVAEYARRVRQLRLQRTRDFIVNYPLQQGTSTEVKNLVSRYIERQRP